jgi:mycothiol system anti-sigma-R factor
MNSINCNQALDAIDSWIDGELSPTAAEILQKHLDECPACKSHSEIESLVKNKIQQSCTVETPAAVRQQILFRMSSYSVSTYEETEIRIQFE